VFDSPAAVQVGRGGQGVAHGSHAIVGGGRDPQSARPVYALARDSARPVYAFAQNMGAEYDVAQSSAPLYDTAASNI
jgi:hypothetical protein